jgi:transglutaminase-like putative cysteine protease
VKAGASYAVRHQTRYLYSDQVAISYNRVHCQPRPCPWQSFREARLSIDPEPAFLARQTDFFGNPVTFFTVQEPHQELGVTVLFEAHVLPRLFDQPTSRWEALVERLRRPTDAETLEASQFRFPSDWVEVSDALRRFAQPSFKAGRDVLEGARDLCRRIHQEFVFDPEATTIATPVQEVLDSRRGVCQDFAHLFIGAMRSLGLAARYVSGYILTTPPPGQERLQGADASHAWVSVWAPPLGWVDLDPTNDLLVNDQHVTLAWGRDFHDVSPMRGVVLGGGTQVVKVGVDVVPLSSVP